MVNSVHFMIEIINRLASGVYSIQGYYYVNYITNKNTKYKHYYYYYNKHVINVN